MDEESMTNRTKHQTFRRGDTVRIMSGPFVSFTGTIEGINQSRARLKVKVSIYGRNKPIPLNFADVEVVST
jgi:transcription termination/antitermination protein NusG